MAAPSPALVASAPVWLPFCHPPPVAARTVALAPSCSLRPRWGCACLGQCLHIKIPTTTFHHLRSSFVRGGRAGCVFRVCGIVSRFQAVPLPCFSVGTSFAAHASLLLLGSIPILQRVYVDTHISETWRCPRGALTSWTSSRHHPGGRGQQGIDVPIQ